MMIPFQEGQAFYPTHSYSSQESCSSASEGTLETEIEMIAMTTTIIIMMATDEK